MEIVTQGIEGYLLEITPLEDPILLEMEAHARRNHFPIVGPLVGRILYQLVKLAKARRVLELGSGFGYSAYWFGRALGESGEITLTEFSKENLGLARNYFAQGRISSQVYFHQGDALEILERLEGQFDIIFNDVDKHQYPEVFRKAGPRVRSGGLLISDNVLWHGRVLEGNPDPSTRGILEYNRLIFEDPEFFSSIIPVRDGISISLKR
ncbi:O-methyltransferase [Acidobacteria bacterium AH-259-A15]|nr:O-methyltransferase [Acidobacteria bacterium AH-259-A15]